MLIYSEKLWGFQAYMYSPSQLHAYYREHFATQGFPALFMGKIFEVYIFFELIFLLSSDL